MATDPIREEVVFSVYVDDAVHIDPAVYALWLKGLNEVDAAAVRKRETEAEDGDESVAERDGGSAEDGGGAAAPAGGDMTAGSGAAVSSARISSSAAADRLDEFLLADTRGQYRVYSALLEQYLRTPELLGQQTECHLDPVTEALVLERYYEFDPVVMREFLGLQVSRGKVSIDDVNEATGVPPKSCRRQYNNLRRIVDTVDDESDFDTPVCTEVQRSFRLSHELAWKYTCVLFLVKHRFNLDAKRKVSYQLAWDDIYFCVSAMLVWWVPGAAVSAPAWARANAGLAIDADDTGADGDASGAAAAEAARDGATGAAGGAGGVHDSSSRVVHSFVDSDVAPVERLSRPQTPTCWHPVDAAFWRGSVRVAIAPPLGSADSSPGGGSSRLRLLTKKQGVAGAHQESRLLIDPSLSAGMKMLRGQLKLKEGRGTYVDAIASRVPALASRSSRARDVRELGALVKSLRALCGVLAQATSLREFFEQLGTTVVPPVQHLNLADGDIDDLFKALVVEFVHIVAQKEMTETKRRQLEQQWNRMLLVVSLCTRRFIAALSRASSAVATA